MNSVDITTWLALHQTALVQKFKTQHTSAQTHSDVDNEDDDAIALVCMCHLSLAISFNSKNSLSMQGPQASGIRNGGSVATLLTENVM